jgi:hypothetical protein
VAAIAVSANAQTPNVWDKEIMPGVTYRMEVQTDPPRLIHGLRFSADQELIRAEAHLAGEEVYDTRPYNGRMTVDEMVAASGAIGGVNGDFFQWGSDPGGDPVNLHVRNGEFLSHPQTSGSRSSVWGWGQNLIEMGQADWRTTVLTPQGEYLIGGLNARARSDEITLFTEDAGLAYADGPVTYAAIQTGPVALDYSETFSGTVTRVFEAEAAEKIAVPEGTALLAGVGTTAEIVGALEPGNSVGFDISFSGLEFERITNVMGGGPILIDDGEIAVTREGDRRHPRTAVGTTPEGDVWYLVIDGRQSMSVGAYLEEVAQVLQRWGCDRAMNLDGGGSSTMAMFGSTLNRPSAGQQRWVANAILFYPEGLEVGEAEPFEIRLPEELVVGQGAEALLVDEAEEPVPDDDVIWSAHGAAWIDQDGNLYPIAEGEVTVSALIDGVTVRATGQVMTEDQAAVKDFRVLPYLQWPAAEAMTLTWFTEAPEPGTLEVDGRTFTTEPVRMTELGYSSLEMSQTDEFPDMFANANYKHHVRVEGLEPGTEYAYTVTQGESEFSNTFETAPVAETEEPIRFITFADSETDVVGRETFRSWSPGPQHAESTGRPEGQENYLVNETESFQENLKVIRERDPDFMLISGDIVQGGGYQRAWDEFFFHMAGKFDVPMTHIPLLPAMGNWENFGGINGGYDPEAIHLARRKYAAYFDTPPNNNPNYQDRYYRIDYGPITVLTLDSSDGLPQGTDNDTNINVVPGEYPGDDLPDLNPGSDQWNWTLEQLADAREQGQIIFVQFHHIPYSSGGHILPTTAPGSSGQAGIPMRQYTPHFAEHGVVAVFCGHNESFERSLVDGVLFYDVGVAGDGLGRPLSREMPIFENEYRQWVAHYDAPELWNGSQLVEGGRHYGHLEVDVVPLGNGEYEITFTPVHIFPVTDENGRVTGFERRVYDDEITVLAS